MPTDEASCELCDAVPFTEWFHSDDLCWVAECESCSVPMVVWRVHDPAPPDEVRNVLHQRLIRVVDSHFADDVWIDENMRSIPTHYHAHARRKHGFPNQPLRRHPSGTVDAATDPIEET